MSETPSIHYGLVLAGGRSSRMGTDKALLLKGKTNLLTVAKHILEHSKCTEVLVSRNQGEGIKDRYQDQGPLAGIEAALDHIPDNTWLTILPVDMPLIRVQDLIQLQNAAQQSNTAVYFESHMLPCIVKVTKELKLFLQAALDGKYKNSIFAMLKTQNAHTITQADPLYLTNANTPSDWCAVKNYF
ncbi:molybdenum cofactor guanylyltransferase [Pseudoalteromonas denitrificans]|uniref:Molybdopterin-guanine dinucleotide biosynthesis protein A n=1 Tax=Pseudoalteromonas denitrificans DSM 6059 TaxID=1123010 RepID=A0A1I1GYG8_9GAMM|nr:molybdenum cofactor guanylyltransferase [Pseudoalteromonas denitrificans]SFC16889.1 molybdopterin-guanine dinucleotide biosynthesis protein A [Pseudoalteromonas denitrificans DSM 6059]